MKQGLLTDIELDVQELKYLTDALFKDYNQTLCEVTKRNITQMRCRLDNLYSELDSLSQLKEIDVPPIVPTPQKNVEELPAIKEEELELVEEIALGSAVVAPPVAIGETLNETISPVFVADKLRTDLRRSISLNDSFRFTRELFGGDSDKMNATIKAIDNMTSLDESLAFLKLHVDLDEENEAVADFMELIKKRFN